MTNLFKKYSCRVTWTVDDNTCTPFTFDSLSKAIKFIETEMDGNMKRLGYFTTLE